MNAPTKLRMDVATYLDWASRQEEGRFELVDGEVVSIASERARYNAVKLAVARALQDAVARAGLNCTVFTDGMTVRIDDHTAREPDALGQCAPVKDWDAQIAEEPVVFVEVLSPSSEQSVTGQKLAEYFTVESILLDMVVDPARRVVTHHRLQDDGTVLTKINLEGEVELDPPGLRVPVKEMVPEVG